MNYQPVRSENQANNYAGPQEATNNAGTEDIIDVGDSDKEDESTQDCFVLPIWTSYSSTISPDLKTDAKRAGPSEEEQVFLDELERLKRQEKEANEEAEALRKKFAQDTENLVIQAGAARARSTNIFSTVSTPAKASSTNLVNTVSTQVSSASPQEGLTLSDPTNPEQDDSEIPPLEDIYQNSSDGIFTTSSYDDEGAVADFTNLETVVNIVNGRALTYLHGLQVKQKPNGIFISQDKYVAEILKKFDFASVKTASTPIETQKPLVKDEEASDVDVHLYRSMIGSLMYVTASRPDIMFAVCACSRFQVTLKTSHLSAVKRIFRYLKGKPKLGLWYPRDSSFDLESYSDSDYAGANLDRKSTTGAALRAIFMDSNQMLDYGFNFMNTKIYIDNESTICIVKNPVYHSKTKHIAIRHHFIRDAYEKKLIQVLKIHTDDNVADLLTKAFDSKKIAQVVSAWIKSKNSLVKHFEDMRLCRPSKEYLQVKLVSMVDDEGRCSMRFTLSTSLKQAISD
ncbi:hypothetical protein Tco_0583980 [Tanacetum coccineum]